MIELVQGDITRIETNAIVNAANPSLLGGGGVHGVIHRPGGKAILDACQKIRAQQGGCPTGEAVVTTAGHLPAKFVIHTVGPVWHGGHESLLHSAYIHSLQRAVENDVRSIAFPNISTGVYHFPKAKVAEIAIRLVREFLAARDDSLKVIFVCFYSENYRLYQRLLAPA